jgi:hypothetical protein
MADDTLALLIPILALCIPIVAIWTGHRRKLAEIQFAAAAERSAQFANDNRALEERVRVLERIVTDKGYDVGAQIEALRDVRAVESQTGAMK